VLLQDEDDAIVLRPGVQLGAPCAVGDRPQRHEAAFGQRALEAESAVVAGGGEDRRASPRPPAILGNGGDRADADSGERLPLVVDHAPRDEDRSDRRGRVVAEGDGRDGRGRLVVRARRRSRRGVRRRRLRLVLRNPVSDREDHGRDGGGQREGAEAGHPEIPRR
jgi:hypothetical protein